MRIPIAAGCLLLSAVAWGQTPPPKIPPSTEGPGTEAGKEAKQPGASWSEAAKHGKQGTDGTGGNPAPAYAKQKAAEQKANQDGGPVVIPAPPPKS
jgi:hypothetical protein